MEIFENVNLSNGRDVLLSKEIAWPKSRTAKIWPLFIPYLGCARRCLFCAQEVQTGRARLVDSNAFARLLAETMADLEDIRAKGHEAPQLAFYGGTFTGLPESLWEIALEFAQNLRQNGLASGYRCSTRPDTLSKARLQELEKSGCQLVELGIQSFDNAALMASGRGYTGKQAKAACSMLAEAGLGPGIQLMPGMPGSTSRTFIEDVRTAIAMKAVCVRFYPCLVLRGSALAEIWQKGGYQPLAVDATIELLAQGYLLANAAAIPVIRMGVASQPGLAEAVLAGPLHPSLGDRVIGRALLQLVMQNRPAPQSKLARLVIPSWLQGCFWGWHKNLAPHWHGLGLTRPLYWDQAKIQMDWQN